MYIDKRAYMFSKRLEKCHVDLLHGNIHITYRWFEIKPLVSQENIIWYPIIWSSLNFLLLQTFCET